MQPSFCRVWKEIDVSKWTWKSRPSLMIPTQRPSLVLLRNAAGHQPKAGPGLGITRIDKGGVAAALDKYLRGIDVGVHKQDSPRLCGLPSCRNCLRAACCCRWRPSAQARPGSRPARSRQEVSVTRPLVSEVTFKFLHHLNEDGAMMLVTNKDPAFVDGWISHLNWILGAQANVWFEVNKAEPLKIDMRLGQPVNDVVFRNYHREGERRPRGRDGVPGRQMEKQRRRRRHLLPRPGRCDRRSTTSPPFRLSRATIPSSSRSPTSSSTTCSSIAATS